MHNVIQRTQKCSFNCVKYVTGLVLGLDIQPITRQYEFNADIYNDRQVIMFSNWNSFNYSSFVSEVILMILTTLHEKI